MSQDNKVKNWKDDKVLLTIEDLEGVANPFFVGINGYPYYIVLGIEVPVPRAVVHVLENAQEIVTKYVLKADGTGNTLKKTKRKRVMFTVKG